MCALSARMTFVEARGTDVVGGRVNGYQPFAIPTRPPWHLISFVAQTFVLIASFYSEHCDSWRVMKVPNVQMVVFRRLSSEHPEVLSNSRQAPAQASTMLVYVAVV